MACTRCGGETGSTGTPWCADCERLYDTWVRNYAADIVWQTGMGAAVAMVIGLGGLVLGLGPLVGIVGVLVGFGTFIGVRQWSKGRRRTQFLTSSLPRAYLPGVDS